MAVLIDKGSGNRLPDQITKRDYSLVGRDTKLAEERGLANAEWYACKWTNIIRMPEAQRVI